MFYLRSQRMLQEVRHLKKIHITRLTIDERHKLSTLTKHGIEHARVITRAQILLLANEGKTDKAIAKIFALSPKTPYEIRKRYHTGGIEKALYDRPRPGQPRRFTGREEAEIVAIACT